jgi:hypothetical protein
MLKVPSVNTSFPVIIGIFIGYVVFIPGCYLVEPEGNIYLLEIETENTQYSFNDIGEEVRFYIKNRSGVPVYLLIPGPYITLEKQVHTQWVNLGTWYGWLGIGPWPQAIEPGDTFPGVPLQLTSETIDGPGLYRFRIKIYSNQETNKLLPLDKRVSNPFMINSKH